MNNKNIKLGDVTQIAFKLTERGLLLNELEKNDNIREFAFWVIGNDPDSYRRFLEWRGR